MSGPMLKKYLLLIIEILFTPANHIGEFEIRLAYRLDYVNSLIAMI